MILPAIFLLGLGISANVVNGDSFLTPLANYIKSMSDPDVPPQKDAGSPVIVGIVHALLNVIDADKEHNTITSEGFTTTTWSTGITWDPNEYGGVDIITLPAERFWTPIIQPIDTAVKIHDLSNGVVLLYSNGTALHTSIYSTTSPCDVSHIEVGATCSSNASVWGYTKDTVAVASINIMGANFGAVGYFEGSKYQITGGSMNMFDLLFNGRTYQILEYTARIQKKPGHHQRAPFKMAFSWH